LVKRKKSVGIERTRRAIGSSLKPAKKINRLGSRMKIEAFTVPAERFATSALESVWGTRKQIWDPDKDISCVEFGGIKTVIATHAAMKRKDRVHRPIIEVTSSIAQWAPVLFYLLR
jgi:hypothetical protein